MQASYNVAGENGHDAAAQLETRIRHDAQSADPATVQVLDGIARYVRQAVEKSAVPVAVEIDVTIRARQTPAIGQAAHLAPRTGLVATTSDSGLEAVPRGDEGDEVGISERAGEVIRSLSLVSDEELERIENDALAAARSIEQSASPEAAQ